MGLRQAMPGAPSSGQQVLHHIMNSQRAIRQCYWPLQRCRRQPAQDSNFCDEHWHEVLHAYIGSPQWRSWG